MKTAIIIHGLPTKEGYFKPDADSESNSHWLPWLQHELIIRGISAQTPEMPVPYEPVYQDWKEMFERFTINEETILVGHSCGGGFLLRYLSEENIRVGKVVLVAPWIDTEKKLDTGMFDFTLDTNLVSKTRSITIFESTNDSEGIQQNIEYIKQAVPHIHVVTFKDYGHFCYKNLKTRAFPELLEECLK